GIAELRHFDGERLAALVQRVAVELRAGLHQKQTAEPSRVEPRHVAGDANLAKIVELSLVDRESQCKSPCRRVVLGTHAGISIATAAIVKADLLAVLVNAISVIDVTAGQKADDRGSRGLDHGFELAIGESVIADENDLPNRCLLAF